jgi:hypothetical protein
MDLLKNGTDEEREKILGGLAANLRSDIVLRNSIMSGGFTNMSTDNEFAFAFHRNLQCNDMIYGDEKLMSSTSVAALCYRNDASYQYWNKDESSACYGYWAGPSISINNANKVAMFLTDDVVGDSEKLKDYKARALSVWCLGYMRLMERFTKSYLHGGKDSYGMPIYEKFAYQDVVEPSSAVETWDIIKEKLRMADKLFKESGIGDEGFTIGTTHDLVYDIDRGIALYLLARADLQTGDYAECITACQTILDKYGWNFIKEEAYGISTDRLDALCDKTDDAYSDKNAFLSVAVNPECMFGWADDSNVYNWSFLNTFNEAQIRIDSLLHDMFDDRDFRKSRFTDHEVTYPFLDSNNNEVKSSIKKYENLKFAATIASDQTERRSDKSNSDVCFIRTSEVLLMMAEAQVMNGDESGAKATLNKLLAARTTDGAQTLTCDNYASMKGMSTFDMVKLQLRMEMWGEKDLMFFAHKRWNEDVVRDTNSNHWVTTGVKVEHMTWDIPQEEQSANRHWINVIYK